jgi:hypothetical protein
LRIPIASPYISSARSRARNSHYGPEILIFALEILTMFQNPKYHQPIMSRRWGHHTPARQELPVRAGGPARRGNNNMLITTILGAAGIGRGRPAWWRRHAGRRRLNDSENFEGNSEKFVPIVKISGVIVRTFTQT